MKFARIFFFIICFYSSFLVAQIATIETTLPSFAQPKPTVSSLGTFAEIPVEPYTGTPSINIPIKSFNGLSNVNFNFGLSYHLSNINFLQKSSDTGTAWSLIGMGVISRTVKFLPDEGIPTLEDLRYDDQYTLNLPSGETATFQIKPDQNYMPTEVVFTGDDNNLKIMFSFDSQTKKILNFTVFSSKGIKYVFDKVDVNVALFEYWPWGSGNYNTNQTHFNKTFIEYNSSFHLTKVVDNNNNEIAEYLYDTFTLLQPNSALPKYHVVNKLKSVNIKNKGKLSFNYTYESSYDDLAPNYNSQSNTHHSLDPYQLNEIIIYDNNNVLQESISLNYSFKYFEVKDYQDGYFTANKNYLRRFLNSVQFKNNQGTVKYKEELTYYDLIDFADLAEFNNGDYYILMNPYGFLNVYKDCDIPSWYPLYGGPDNNPTSRNSNQIGALKSLSKSLGGGYLFEYEANDFSRQNSFGFSYNNESISDDEFFLLNNENKEYELVYQTNFNTVNSRDYFFNVTGEPDSDLNRYFFKFQANPLTIPSWVDPNDYPTNETVFTLHDDTREVNWNQEPVWSQVHDFSNLEVGNDIHVVQSCQGRGLIRLNPNTYRINVSTFMLLNTTGTIEVYREKPIQNLKRRILGAGIRIKNVSIYENMSVINQELSSYENLVNTQEYKYESFNDANKSSGVFMFGTYEGSSRLVKTQICYENVKVSSFGGDLGYTLYTYKTNGIVQNVVDFGGYNLGVVDFLDLLKSPMLLKMETFNHNHQKVFEKSNEYSFEILNENYWYVSTLITRPAKSILTSSTTKNYFYNNTSSPDIVITNESFTYYPSTFLPQTISKSNSQGEILTTKYFYHTGNSIHSQNRISEIERIETYRESELLSKSQINYNNNWTNNVSYLPQTIVAAKGSENLEARLHYLEYDEYSHPLEVQQENGMPIAYIWGYNQTQPIAKIENATYAQVEQYVSNLQTLSNGNNEQNLINALNDLRTALPNAMVTTYTYKPLVGISTVTDSKGDKQTYHYDSFNRLQYVKDKDGNILSENQYHYRTQN